METAIDDRAGLYTFWGDFGAGKSMALQVVVNELREAHLVEGYYAPFGAILDHLRACYSQREGADEFWEWVLDVPVLALDEVTRFSESSQWQVQQLFMLADTRYRRKADHLTMFATNADPRVHLPPDDGLGYLFSRLREGTLIEMRGDLRSAVR